MTRGPRPLPTLLKFAKGNPGRRPLNMDEPVIKADLESVPDWLSESQAEIWRDAIAEAPNGLLKSLDASVFLTWVVACDLHRKATQELAKAGLVVKSPVKGNPMQNPYLSIVNRQALIMMKAAAEMGFTPSSRSRIKVKNELPGNKSKFGQFVG